MRNVNSVANSKKAQKARTIAKTMSSAVEKEGATWGTGNYGESRRIREMHTCT